MGWPRGGGARPATEKAARAMKAKRFHRLQRGRCSLRSALVNGVMRQGGRTDVPKLQVTGACVQAAEGLPLRARAGYPLVRLKGSADPARWRTLDGKDVAIDVSRKPWLPDEFAQGVKPTKRGAWAKSEVPHSGTFTVYMAPCGRTFYLQHQVEGYLGRALSPRDGFRGQLRFAALQLKQTRLDSDSSFFRLLSGRERAALPPADELHWCVISARRARTDAGARDIAVVQTAFTSAGVAPTWYVDKESVHEYRALGLKAVVGGKLTAARNKALRDARSQGKACVQSSDDISMWEYHHGDVAEEKTIGALNAAHAAARHYIISPVAAARFILAKMRGSPPGGARPRLGGVYCLGDCSRTFGGEAFSTHSFILGDFFVADGSTVKFDQRLTLKEDYDFTCAHIKAHGSVLRCQRMTVRAKHYSNGGGAVANRDAKGREERRNIATLRKKWPRAIFPHRSRENEVSLKWPCARGAAGRPAAGAPAPKRRRRQP